MHLLQNRNEILHSLEVKSWWRHYQKHLQLDLEQKVFSASLCIVLGDLDLLVYLIKPQNSGRIVAVTKLEMKKKNLLIIFPMFFVSYRD